MFYRGGRHCIFMLQTKTNTNTVMVYRINYKLDFILYRKIYVLFVVFSVLVCSVSIKSLKIPYLIEKNKIATITI